MFFPSDYPARVIVLPALFTLSLEGSVAEGSERSVSKDLAALFSTVCALFGATEPSQLLWLQLLPHSFPCNGGGGGVTVLLPFFRIFFLSDYPMRIVVLSERRELKDLAALFSTACALFHFT
jgi:hypothetical protein